jgi:hypothetical protein
VSKKRGRPSKLNSQVSAKIFDLAKEGKTDAEIAKIVGICPRTLYYWKGSHADFLHALKEAQGQADALVEASLYRRATGYYHPEDKIFLPRGSSKPTVVRVMKHYPPDTAAAIFWLKNRNPVRWQDRRVVETPPEKASDEGKVSFEKFCERAGYPAPFPKQVEMMLFVIADDIARLLLGSRGYGKTDYAVILGLAYELYLDPTATSLIVTKSDERNAAMLEEIAKAAEANGVRFEKKNSSCLRVAGLIGKDHSVSAVTVGSTSVRGRHPKRVIMDDPVTEEDISEATRKRVQRLYNELNKLTKNVVVIGQPVHKSDLYGTLRPLLKRMEVAHGSIPELDHDLEAMKLAGVSWESISASYHLKVVSEAGFPFEKVKYVDHFPMGDAVAFIDPSFEGGDFTALSCITGYFDGVAVQGHLWKKAWNHCLPEMVERMKACGVRRVCFEANSLGDQPVIMLREALKDTGIGVVGKKSTTYKHSRIMNAGAYAEAIHLSKTSDRAYIEQVVNYEYGVKHDDAPDSLATGLEWIGLIRGKKL